MEGRAEASAVILGDSLYVFGGMAINNTSGDFVPLKTIERLNLRGIVGSQKDSFTLIDLKLPIAAANIGILPAS